jgi:NDP-sugar pyrophosphorylase family protein
MHKRAVILAGGKGTRLKPYTIALPKPLVPIGETPILEIIIKQLVNHGFSHITITLNHFADIIKAYFGNGEKYGIIIDYSLEATPLSTMGPLKLIKDLPEIFLVLNGDILTDLDFSVFYDFHCANKSKFTIGAHSRVDSLDYGVLVTDNDFNLVEFKEKPKNTYLVSMGIYCVNKSNLNMIPNNTFFGFDHLMYKLLEVNQPVKIYKYDGYWLDIGRPDDYERAINEFGTKKFF